MTRSDPAIIKVRWPFDLRAIRVEALSMLTIGFPVNVIAELRTSRVIAFRVVPQTDGVLLVSAKPSQTAHKLQAEVAVERGLDELVRLFEEPEK